MKNEFVRGYIDGALWASVDDNGDSLKNYELSDTAKAELTIDATKFYDQCSYLWDGENDDYKAGIDFWFTRNGHGSGFWDGSYMHGEILTKMSHDCGEKNLLLDKDGKITT